MRALLLETISDRMVGKTGIVFLAGEALFLRRGRDPPVPDYYRGAVVGKTLKSPEFAYRIRKAYR